MVESDREIIPVAQHHRLDICLDSRGVPTFARLKEISVLQWLADTDKLVPWVMDYFNDIEAMKRIELGDAMVVNLTRVSSARETKTFYTRLLIDLGAATINRFYWAGMSSNTLENRRIALNNLAQIQEDAQNIQKYFDNVKKL